MLIFPKTLLPSWSDYHSAVVDISAIVTAQLNGTANIASSGLALQHVLDKGLDGEWTVKHAEAVAAKLSEKCVRNGRYFCNVSTEQQLDWEDLEFAVWPKVVEPWWRRFWSPGANNFNMRRGMRRGIKPLPAEALRDSDLLLIDAPISMNLETGETCLCDIPPFARRERDARLPLILSDAVRQRLTDYASTGADWIPFCRTLGIVRRQARGQAIQALQISVRTPRFPEIDWPIRLIEEASGMRFHKSYRSDESFSHWITIYRALVQDERTKRGAIDSRALAAACGPDFASLIVRHGSLDVSYILKYTNNPYLHAEGFWIALATILPAWRDYFPLTGPEVDALLRKFDAAYDQEWKDAMQDLAMSGLFRFTPEVMDRIRARIAGLHS